jgi:hypothetical protein
MLSVKSVFKREEAVKPEGIAVRIEGKMAASKSL